MLTMKAKYALRALTELARAGESRLQAHELAERTRAPVKFLESILVELRAAGFIDSRRGQRRRREGGRMSATAAARFLVSGRVQGVAFRAYTRAQAQALGLRGHARNLADGRVEVLAVGDAAAVERLADWLKTGSPMARVDAVVRSVAADADLRDADNDGGFRIG